MTGAVELAFSLMLSGAAYQISGMGSRNQERLFKQLAAVGHDEMNPVRRKRNDADRLFGWRASVGFLIPYVLLIPSPFPRGMEPLQILLGGMMSFLLSLAVWMVVWKTRFSHFERTDLAGGAVIRARDRWTRPAPPAPQPSDVSGSAREESAARIFAAQPNGGEQ